MSDEDLLVLLLAHNRIGVAPTSSRYYTPHKEIVIGIGNDHVAYLILEDEAYEELMKRHRTDDYL